MNLAKVDETWQRHDHRHQVFATWPRGWWPNITQLLVLRHAQIFGPLWLRPVAKCWPQFPVQPIFCCCCPARVSFNSCDNNCCQQFTININDHQHHQRGHNWFRFRGAPSVELFTIKIIKRAEYTCQKSEILNIFVPRYWFDGCALLLWGAKKKTMSFKLWKATPEKAPREQISKRHLFSFRNPSAASFENEPKQTTKKTR